MNHSNPSDPATSGYNRFLLLVAGLGGLLFGVDVGIIAGALPYLEATSGLNANQLSFIVAAVLLGGVISTLFAGGLADFFGRNKMMIFSGVLFVVSVPAIALSHNYGALVFGRLMQGISGGLIGVVVPLYLAECLSAADRGKGTGIFQWLLTLGIVAAAVIGFYFSGRVEDVAKLGDAQKLFQFKDTAWRGIFWVSLPPGILFVIGAFMVSESPRWLFRCGQTDAALGAFLRSRSEVQAQVEIKEMAVICATEMAAASSAGKNSEPLLQRKYVIPFLLACVILACNQATGVNSIIGYNATIFIQAGLSDKEAHLGYVFLTVINFVMTIGTIALVDRKGRKFLLSLGSAGIIVSLLTVGMVFHKTESQRVDVKNLVQAMVATNETLSLAFYEATATNLLAQSGATIQPFLIYCFMAPFAIGPGVCVWLALSELMPTRIRSNDMSIALLINIAISTIIAAMFLPTVGQYGYSTMFFIFAGCTVVYFITATFFLPETKGKTLEEIEEHFEGGHHS
jgi:SP family myo-inositol transporter-like MFS transporter 13